jgi:hypothetical protein
VKARIRRTWTLETLEERTLPSFLPAVDYPVGAPAAPISVAVGSLRGNGIQDIVTDNINTHTVSVLLGNGDGTFGSPVQYPFDENSWQDLALGDVNGDGHLDIVVAGSTTSVLLGNGDGTFQPAITTRFGAALGQLADFKLADINGDGKLDIVAVNSIGSQAVLTVALGNGDGTFRAPYSFNAPAFIPNSLALGDFNGDGILDVAIASSETFFDPETGEIFAVGAVTIFPGTGGGFFGAPTAINTNGGARSIVAGDFNGDGHLDLLTIDTSVGNPPSISVLPGNGDGTFGAPITTPTPQGPLGPVVVADFNRDGILDVAAVSSTRNSVNVFLGNGDATFQAPLTFAVGTNPFGLAVGDFNGDDFPDLVTANFGASHSVSVLLNDAGWGTAPSGGRSLPRGSAHSFDLFTLPGVAEPMAAPGWAWAPPTPTTTISPTAALPFQESTHPAEMEIPVQPPEFVADELFTWPSIW